MKVFKKAFERLLKISSEKKNYIIFNLFILKKNKKHKIITKLLLNITNYLLKLLLIITLQ